MLPYIFLSLSLFSFILLLDPFSPFCLAVSLGQEQEQEHASLGVQPLSPSLFHFCIYDLSYFYSISLHFHLVPRWRCGLDRDQRSTAYNFSHSLR
ncbi:hypothetical protein BOTBODRAFT_231672 [Botryobasidium botryosum FD-172 SS1]|uniref:Secreted protein n=1 Tax=Botryobasidium botryosum (strain FD-172 SS1) TaxID=930990 RepID=A0A067LXA9_BOTB1|nr:hypothetical protein BOTBODRAFT_231672 [Botryobasidium botryosum FD-172 SS1]